MNQEASKEGSANVSTSLAQERTDLATARTSMAAERTLMAWIRTSFSMIGFGITMVKIFQSLQQSEGPPGQFHGQHARRLGLALIILGTVIIIPAVLQHRSMVKKLNVQYGGPSRSLSLIVASLVGVFGILALLSGLFDFIF